MNIRVASVVVLLATFTLGCPKPGTAPDAGIRLISQALEEGRPQDALDAIPPKWMEDAGEIVHLFGERMDPEVWDRGFAMTGKLMRVLDEKRDFIMKHPMVAMMTAGADMEEVNAQLDGAVKMYGDLTKSEISTVEGLKTLELKNFAKELFASTSDELMKTAPEAMEKFGITWMVGDYETEVLSEENGVAKIRLVPADGSEPTEMALAEVDGYWVSKETADSWDADMAKARAEVETFEIDAETKTQVVAVMDAVEGILDEMLAAQNEVEFGQAVAKAMTIPEQLGLDMGG